MDLVIQTLKADIDSVLRFAPRLFYGLLVLVLFWLLARVASYAVSRVLGRSGKLRNNALFVHRVVSWSISIAGLLLALSVMGFQGVAASMLATGGVAAIVLGFAFREIGENFIAGFFLTFSRPFEVGDLVTTGEFTGTVQAIDLRSIHLRTFDACDVYVPNAQTFTEPLINYTRDGLRRPSFTVGIAYSDKPHDLLELLAQAANSVDDVLDKPKAFVTIDNFGASYIDYKVHFFMDAVKSKRGYIGTLNDVKLACWKALTEAGMTFSTDITTALDIKTAPAINVTVDKD